MTTGDRVIDSIAVEVYTVPTDQPEADGTLAWDKTVVVLVRARSGMHEWIGWTYAGQAAKGVVDDILSGVILHGDLLSIPAHHEAMVRACRNLGRPGLASCAISAVDIALWDLKARYLRCSLADLVGRARASARIYGSGGFTTYDEHTTTKQLQGWIDAGIPRIKIKIGESRGTDPDRDLSRVASARRVVGPDAELYVDANGAYSQKQAVRLGRRIEEDYGVTWFEEPVSSDNLEGLRVIRAAVTADVAAGEYGYSPDYFARMLNAKAVDCLQIDATRCGGYTDWLAIAGLAAAQNVEVSAHCAPNLHAYVGVSVPNLRHLEYFHDHVRIEHLLFDGALDPKDGALKPTGDQSGHGMVLRQTDAERYRTT